MCVFVLTARNWRDMATNVSSGRESDFMAFYLFGPTGVILKADDPIYVTKSLVKSLL
jgi:hypothetical protein